MEVLIIGRRRDGGRDGGGREGGRTYSSLQELVKVFQGTERMGKIIRCRSRRTTRRKRTREKGSSRIGAREAMKAAVSEERSHWFLMSLAKRLKTR